MSSTSWMDALILVIMVVYAIKGWKNGLILSIFHTGSFVIAAIVAKTYYSNLSQYMIEDTTIFRRIRSMFTERIDDIVATDMATSSNIFEIMHLPKSMENFLMKSETVRSYSDQTMEGINGYVSDILSKMLIDFISILILFFLVKISLFVISHFLNGLASLPVLKQINHTGGLMFGVFMGMFIVFLFLAVITPITTLTQTSIFSEGLESSTIAKALYDHNPIISFVKSLTIL